MDLGPLCLDLIQFVIGKRVKNIRASLMNTQTFSYEVEDSASVLLEMEDGIHAMISTHFNISENVAVNRLEVYGTDGVLVLEGTDFRDGRFIGQRDLKCNSYTDVQKMLQAESLDAIDVLTPEKLHYDAVMAGLAEGCHVFVEKPLEIYLVKACSMIAFAKEKERLLMVGHITRFDPRYMNMKQALERGDIGRIRSIYTRRSDKREYFGIYKRTPVVFILGVHDIDQILWYKNELPPEVYAKRSLSVEGEDMLCAMMTFQDGTLATMDCNWLTPKSWPAPQDQYTQITGDSGVLRMQNPDQAFSLCSEERYEFPYMFANRDIYGRMEEPLGAELSHFVDCMVLSKPSSILLPEDAINVIRVATAIIRSCEQNQPVVLSLVNS